MVQVKFINHGIACRIGDTIYLNKELLYYNMKLAAAILRHEKNHSSSYKLSDIKQDLSIKELKDMKGEYLSFVLTNPSSWTEFLPVCSYEGNLVWNPTLTFTYLLVIGLGVVLWLV